MKCKYCNSTQSNSEITNAGDLLDNSIDWLQKYYKGDDALIHVDITKDDKEFHLKIRNSNKKNIPVFSNLGPIFNFEDRTGSKQDVHVISRGMLGDALKQILSLGYVLIHVDYDGSGFEDKQSEYPLIIRHNGKESHIILNVDMAQQTAIATPNYLSEELTHTDTEIEIVLPIIDEVRNSLTRNYIEQFFRKYSIFTTDISFKVRILDDSTPPATRSITEQEIMPEFLKALNTIPAKGIVNIDLPALHPIDKDWSNTESVHWCKPEEFKRRILNVHDKSTSVWKVLLKFKEGTQIEQTENNRMSIAELLQDKNRDKKIEGFFNELRKEIDASKKLELPYTTNPKKRGEILVERLSKIHDIDTTKEASYKLITDFDDDKQSKKVYFLNEDGEQVYTYQQGKGLVNYPFAIEILGVPLNDPTKKIVDTVFIGAINYSISPIDNNFKGDYSPLSSAENINELLEDAGFNKRTNKGKIPCVIICNLITPRREPHGYDKSSIDITPFKDAIIKAVVNMTKDIQTYKAVGWHFKDEISFDNARHIPSNKKVTAKSIIEKFLTDEFGLPPK